MDAKLAEALQQQELITAEEVQCIAQLKEKPVSIHAEALILLYLGVLLLCTGLGVVIYNNIDQIGHTVIVLTIAAACIACLAWCFKKGTGYAPQKVNSPTVLFDYILLLGCLLLLIFTGYIQFTYQFFGERWGLATFIPMILLFGMAYYFDHMGVLSLAITNLAAWAGISIAPLGILRDNDFRDARLIYTGIALGIGLLLISFLTLRQQIKRHFALVYQNFGAHILFISLLAAQFHFHSFYLLWFLLVAVTAFLGFRYAVSTKSYYFLVTSLLYFYISLSYVVIVGIDHISRDIEGIYLGLFYIVFSGIAIIRILMSYNKKFRADASL